MKHTLEGMSELIGVLKDLKAPREGIMKQLLDPDQIRALQEQTEILRRARESEDRERAERKRRFDEEAPLREAEKKRIEDERALCITAREDIGKQNALLTRIAVVLERLCEKVEKMPAPIVLPSVVPQSPINPMPNPHPHGPYGPWVGDRPYTITWDGHSFTTTVAPGVNLCTSKEGGDGQ